MLRSLDFNTLGELLRTTVQESRSIKEGVVIKKNWVVGDACFQVNSQHGIQRGEFSGYSDMGNQQPMYHKAKCPNWPATNIVMLDRLTWFPTLWIKSVHFHENYNWFPTLSIKSIRFYESPFFFLPWKVDMTTIYPTALLWI